MWTSLAAAFERLVERSFAEFIAMVGKNSLSAVFVSLTKAVSIEDKYNNLKSLLEHTVITDQIKSELKECVFTVDIYATSILNLGSAVMMGNTSSEIKDWDAKKLIIERFLSALKRFSRDLDWDYQLAKTQLDNALNEKGIVQTIVDAEAFLQKRIGPIISKSEILGQVNTAVTTAVTTAARELIDTKVKLTSCLKSLTTFTAKTLSRSFCNLPAYQYFYAAYSFAAPLVFFFTCRDSLVQIVRFYFSQAGCSVSGFIAGVVLTGTGAAVAAMVFFHWYIAFLAICGKLPGQSTTIPGTRVDVSNADLDAEIGAEDIKQKPQPHHMVSAASYSVGILKMDSLQEQNFYNEHYEISKNLQEAQNKNLLLKRPSIRYRELDFQVVAFRSLTSKRLKEIYDDIPATAGGREAAIKRILEDYFELEGQEVGQVWKIFVDSDIFIWTVLIANSSGGYSTVTINFPRDYPARAPSVRIVDQLDQLLYLDDMEVVTNWMNSMNAGDILSAIANDVQNLD